MTHVLRAFCLVLALLAAPLAAQEGPSAIPITGVEGALDSDALNYSDWERMAERAEAEIVERRTSSERLEAIRGRLAQWRAALLTAQNANSARIATLREQIAALGPAPANGETEAEEISRRRQELAQQLVRLQAPGIAAEEAYRRADGLIREIDRTLRDRQADELLQLWPSPLNPTNWPIAAIGLSDTVLRLWDEGSTAWADRNKRAELVDNLPLIVVLLGLALALVVYVRRWVGRWAERLQGTASVRGQRLWALLASTGEVVLPTLGMVALATALLATGMPGEVGMLITLALPAAGLAVFAAGWLGGRAFPKAAAEDGILPVPPERRAEGRLMALLLGLVLAAEMLRAAAMEAQGYADATTAVMSFPILLAGGLILMRVGRILRKAGHGGERSYALRLLAILARGIGAVGMVSPALAAIGYVQAANALIYPTILTLGLITLLFILQQLISDLWAMVNRTEGQGRDGLLPVLAGFAMVLAALPLFALIWGARASDITELWAGFTEGFTLGETRIAPSDFMIFAIIFVAGFLLTRLFQGALRTTILPKTTMDQGGQTALVSGVGYVGVFLAALVAINATGLDLSGLAIVAGALSVGIGFGLQNIVSNFISGIILLIERPVSEGDWIEVGGVQGRVRAISVRSTRIETFDRNDVIVPNANLITGQVTNWTRFNLTGRLILPVSVALGSDTRQVERILREIVEAQHLAILNPPPLVLLMGYTPTQLNFEIRVILRDVNFSLQVRTEMNHQVLARLAAEGINIAPPPLPPPVPDPVRIAETVLALTDLVGSAPAARRKRAAPEEPEVKGAER
jgi:small-conductance mechanosensitive channel